MGTRERVAKAVGAASEATKDGAHAYVVALEEMLGRLVGCDLMMWNDIDAAAGSGSIDGSLAHEWRWLVPAMVAVSPSNAMPAWFLSRPGLARPTRMSDLVENCAFRRGRVFNELFVPMGARYQLGVPTRRSAGRYARGWALNRDRRDFSDDDVDLLATIQGSLALIEDLIFGSSATVDVKTEELDHHAGEVLTKRETQVLELLTRGWTAAHIGHHLRISTATVRKHLEHIYAKLGAHDRLLAVERARPLLRRASGGSEPEPAVRSSNAHSG